MGRAIADSLYSLGSSHRRVLRVRSVHVQAQKSRDMRIPRKKRRSQLRALHDCLFRSCFADNLLSFQKSGYIHMVTYSHTFGNQHGGFPRARYTRPPELQGS